MRAPGRTPTNPWINVSPPFVGGDGHPSAGGAFDENAGRGECAGRLGTPAPGSESCARWRPTATGLYDSGPATKTRPTIAAEVAARARKIREVRLLLSVTGEDLVAAVIIWTRIGDATRLRNGKAVSRYGGLAPSVHQSCEQDRRGHISTNGDTTLRRILVQAAHQVARHGTGTLGIFFRRKQKQIGCKRAIVALARKLLVVAWRILLTGEPYRSVRAARYQEKLRLLEKMGTQEAYPVQGILKELLGQPVLIQFGPVSPGIAA